MCVIRVSSSSELEKGGRISLGQVSESRTEQEMEPQIETLSPVTMLLLQSVVVNELNHKVKLDFLVHLLSSLHLWS